MKITETITETITTTRECCQSAFGDIVSNANGGFGFAECKHCGASFKQKRYTDAAGDTDWEWVKVVDEKEVCDDMGPAKRHGI